MTEIYLITSMLGVTFLIRYAMFAAAGRFIFPPLLERALRYVPPAVLTAIILPAVLIPTGQKIDFSYDNAYLIGAVMAFGVGWISRSFLATIVVGMMVFLGWQWIISWILS